jgi:hypothetical protein
MSTAPRFFQQPLKYMHWAAIEKPAIFYSLIIGGMGPVIAVAAPPIRNALGDRQRPQIPMTYPSELPCFVSWEGGEVGREEEKDEIGEGRRKWRM